MIAEKWVRLSTKAHLIRVSVEVDSRSYSLVCNLTVHKTVKDFIKYICCMLSKKNFEKYLLILAPSHIILETKTLQENDTLKLITRTEFDEILDAKKRIYPVKEVKYVEHDLVQVPEKFKVQTDLTMFDLGEVKLSTLDVAMEKPIDGLCFMLDKLPSKNVDQQVNYGCDRKGCDFQVTYVRKKDRSYILSAVRAIHNHMDVYSEDVQPKIPLGVFDQNKERKEDCNKGMMGIKHEAGYDENSYNWAPKNEIGDHFQMFPSKKVISKPQKQFKFRLSRSTK
ncbi:unnamed protein product [Moneuplotes crassus]|uniref:Uncharacterized protein n=1 Tax=Euplotes crassus TaxID=5936 RepID=A0AAD2D2V0_EUPCR|nr:unnamed protein product [Moneuplotes crassus]